LGVSKQATSQLIDTLVVRGYLERQPNPEDRRRVTIEATERGRAAAAAVRSAVVAVDEELAGVITPAQLKGMRSAPGSSRCATSGTGSRMRRGRLAHPRSRSRSNCENSA
jgi:hypothetical protein